MAQNSRKSKEEVFEEALKGKKIPILTLDNKWYRLFNELGRDAAKEYEEQLNTVLRKQGRINNEIKDIKRLKKKLMAEIVPMVDEASGEDSAEAEKKIEQNKRLIEECNSKLEQNEEELLELPRVIDEFNMQLMLVTMEYCYNELQDNTEEISEIEDWVTQIRIELKKRLIEKQDMETKNHNIYSYMHDIFGADVIDLFDMKYNPDDKYPKSSEKKEGL